METNITFAAPRQSENIHNEVTTVLLLIVLILSIWYFQNYESIAPDSINQSLRQVFDDSEDVKNLQALHSGYQYQRKDANINQVGSSFPDVFPYDATNI